MCSAGSDPPPPLSLSTHTYPYAPCMQCNGKEILWQHLKNLYQSDGGAMKDAAGLAMVPKLKYEHVNLTPFSKMRVDLAAQVHALTFS